MAGQFGAAFALTLILCLDSGRAAETSSESKIVAAIYKQLFRHAPDAERSWNYSYELQSGKTVKEIVKELCSTKEFIHIVSQGSTSQGLTTCFDRILGRPPTTEELQRHAELLAGSDWKLVISGLLESSEYKLRFGDFTVPYPRNEDSKLLTYTPRITAYPKQSSSGSSSSSGHGGRFGTFLLFPEASRGYPEGPASGAEPRALGWEPTFQMGGSPTPTAQTPHATAIASSATSTPEPIPSTALYSAADAAIARLGKANIAFNTPESMAYGETKTIQLLLGVSMSGRELEEKIVEEGSRQHADQIRASAQMEATLTGDAFDITPITSARQAVSSKEVTEWRWDVRAKRFSSQRLHLSLNAIIEANGKESSKLVRVFDRDIVVRITSFHSAALLAEDNWQLSAAIFTGILGAVGWLLKKLFSKRGRVTA